MVSEEDVAEKKDAKNPVQKAHDEEIQNVILVLAAAVIRCNRNYTGDTEHFIHRFMAKHFGQAGLKQRMESVYQHIDSGTEPFTRIACKELNILATYESKISIVNFLFGVADADEHVNAKEIRVISKIAGYLGISAAEFTELKQNFVGRNNPYFILGIEEGASPEQVKHAYRELTLKYHPDKTKEKDGGAKFRQIKKAYDTIKRSKPN